MANKETEQLIAGFYHSMRADAKRAKRDTPPISFASLRPSVAPLALSRHERTVIEVAVTVLNAAVRHAETARVDNAAVRLALRCLLPYFTDPTLLTMFWNGASMSASWDRAVACSNSFTAIWHYLDARGVALWAKQASERPDSLPVGNGQRGRE